jgi:hypothetical protein
VLWQWNAQHEARAALTQARAKLTAVQNEFSGLQTETQQLDESAAQWDNKLNVARTATENREAMDQKFAAWKQRVRARLLGADYEWPDDLPFVRIPKSILPQLRVREPVAWPGTVKEEARELLGLSPTEREQMEAALQKHMATLNDLMNAGRFETNTASRTQIPSDALSSQVYGLPALGAGVKQSGDLMESALKTTLGDERWSMIAKELEYQSSDGIGRALNLDAGEKGQEVSVWVDERNNIPVAGFSWGGQNSVISSYGMALKLFLPDAPPLDGRTAEEQLGILQAPPALAQPAMEWIRQQAQARLEKKGDQ